MKRNQRQFLQRIQQRTTNAVSLAEMIEARKQQRKALALIVLLHAAGIALGITIGVAFSGCSVTDVQGTTNYDGGTINARHDGGATQGADAGGTGGLHDSGAVAGDAGVGGDAGTSAASDARLDDAGGADAGGPGGGGDVCRVSVALERCGSTDVYRCRVVSDDPTLTNDLHVSGCNAPDGTACAPCCPGTPAYLCPPVLQ